MQEVTNLIDFYQKFSDEQSCRDYLEKMRWPNQITCPHCGSIDSSYKYNDGRLFKCRECRKQFTVRVGTIFEDSKLPLQKWFLAVYLATSLKKGISSIQLSKYLTVTQKTAWFMLHRIRHATQQNSNSDKFTGIVEADETYIGGRRQQNMMKDNKSAVIGIAEKQGFIKVKALGLVNVRKEEHIMPFLLDNIELLSVLHTDESRLYRDIDLLYKHRSVHHKRHFVENGAHTNNIEAFWSHLKRGIDGVYHHVSPKHLQKYCSEYEYRYNTRLMYDGQRFNDWFTKINGRLTYKELLS